MKVETAVIQGIEYLGHFVGVRSHSLVDVGREAYESKTDNISWFGTGKIQRVGARERVVFPFQTPDFEISPFWLAKVTNTPMYDAIVNYGQFGPFYMGHLYPRPVNENAIAQINDVALKELFEKAKKFRVSTDGNLVILKSTIINARHLINRGLCISDPSAH